MLLTLLHTYTWHKTGVLLLLDPTQAQRLQAHKQALGFSIFLFINTHQYQCLSLTLCISSLLTFTLTAMTSPFHHWKIFLVTGGSRTACAEWRTIKQQNANDTAVERVALLIQLRIVEALHSIFSNGRLVIGCLSSPFRFKSSFFAYLLFFN